MPTRNKFERVDHQRQLACLVLHILGCGSRLLDQGSVVLGHFIHLADRLIDLFNPVALLLAGRGHIAGYLLHGRDDLIHRLAGMIDQLAAGFDFQSARLQSSR